MNFYLKNNSKGMITTLLVLLLAIFAILFLTGASQVDLNEKLSAKNFLDIQKTKASALWCSEEALLKYRNDYNYGGAETFIVSGSGLSCDIMAFEYISNQKRIRTQSVLGNKVSQMEIYATSTRGSIIINSWDENANF